MRTPIGTISQRNVKGVLCLKIKVSNTSWECLGKYNWQNVYGAVPDGFIIDHLDGNKLNCDFDNLYIRIKETGVKTQFKKGSKPFNKGKKMIEYCKPEAIVSSTKTRFKKGHLPHNATTDGFISKRYNNGVPYLVIRISISKWQYLKHYNWEKVNPPVPKGFVLIHKDYNPLNCEIDNLEVISRADNANRNSIHIYSPEIKEKIKLHSKLKKVIHEKQK